MKINNIETETMDLKLLSRVIGSPEIKTNTEWIDGRLEPFIEEQFFKFKPMELEFLLEKENDNDAEKEISKLVALAGKCEIIFDDIDMKYMGHLVDVGRDKITIGRYTITLSFEVAYGYDENVTALIQNGEQVILESSMETPVKITITPTIDVAELFITGLGDEIILNNVKAGKSYVLDGEKGLVEEDGVNYYDNYESWGFPTLTPGTNTITTNTGIELKLEYKPRWL